MTIGQGTRSLGQVSSFPLKTTRERFALDNGEGDAAVARRCRNSGQLAGHASSRSIFVNAEAEGCSQQFAESQQLIVVEIGESVAVFCSPSCSRSIFGVLAPKLTATPCRGSPPTPGGSALSERSSKECGGAPRQSARTVVTHTSLPQVTGQSPPIKKQPSRCFIC